LKRFSKAETLSLVIVFVILIAVAVPNFVTSLRRARDQTRRDDMGVMMHALAEYYAEFEAFPLSSPDGKIVDCLKPGDKPYQDEKGHWVVDAIPCEWGVDPISNLITGKVYLSAVARDPDWAKGVHYLYMSDGVSFQLFGSMEGKDEAEVDPRIIAENLSCGSRICNFGRSYNCDIPKTLAQCEEERAALLKKK
jgi:type II secretory pathway pseudopilin PulG